MNENFKLYKRLEDLASGKKLEAFVQKQAEECWEQVVSTSPPQVQTGRYIASIQVDPVKREGSEISASVYTDLKSGWHDVFLAEFLEHGTRNI